MTATARIQLAPGYVLHQRPYRESSALLEVFTELHGRVGLVARGVRSPKSRQRGELQPFRPLRLSWNARGELGTLTGVEADAPCRRLQGAALYSAFYLNELLVRLLVRNDPHPRLYACYQASMESLMQGGDIEPLLRMFEKSLLQEIGYGLLLDSEVESGEPVQPDSYYDYHLESGPVLSERQDAQAFVFKGSSLLALEQEQLTSTDVLRDAKRLMRSALNLYLGNKPLKSRELFGATNKASVPPE
ncbi:MAG: DNA repair protein RecO [Gammaproteobacteria bacterium]|nr:MAG: DNA repair protein RecO [Gammaproteobacteria bacterium]